MLRLILNKKIIGQTGNNGRKDIEIIIPLKHLSNFWRFREMPLINCKSNLILTWSVNYFLIANPVSNQIAIFAKTDAKLYVLAVTLSTQNNAKLLQQLQQIDFLTLTMFSSGCRNEILQCYD